MTDILKIVRSNAVCEATVGITHLLSELKIGRYKARYDGVKNCSILNGLFSRYCILNFAVPNE